VSDNDTLSIEFQPRGRGKVTVTARRGDTVVYADDITPTDARQRSAFTKALREKVPEANPDAIDAELLHVAAADPPPPPTPAAGEELDVSRFHRPELFHTAEVSGLAVPVVTMTHGKPAGQWHLYLRWADGRRESRPLADSVELTSGGRLWLHPTPADPSVSTPAAWSRDARRVWLAGAPAPDPAALFRELCEAVAYYLEFPPDSAEGTVATLALWVMLTYGYPAWAAVPYLYVGGPMGSGKTRLFDVVAELAFRVLASSNMTGPALFRTLHDRGGVLLYDEAERLRQSTPEVQELLSMLLAGYKRGGKATRLEAVGDTYRTVAFDVFGPKAIACIQGLPPPLASRSIPVMMFRAGPGSPKPKLRVDADAGRWQRLRDDLHALALEAGPTWLELSRQTDVCPEGIGSRDYELWQPLLALAAWVESCGASGLLELVREHALATVAAGKDDAVPETDEVLLEVTAEAVRTGQRLTSREILDRAKEDAPGLFKTWEHARTVTARLKA
jgi:hypothetical protein